jgi:hypothetical protein
METAAINENMIPKSESRTDRWAKAITAGVLVVWLALVFELGANGSFVRQPGSIPVPIIIGVIAPVVMFLAAFLLSESFHHLVSTADVRLMAGIQAWRFAGLGFLALYTNGVLPGFFAWPAGVGDMIIGLTAPWVIMALIQRPDFKSSLLFIGWNLFGILDLVIAISTGALSSGLAPGIVGAATTAPMAHLPLVLIPAYLVPLFIMLHLATLFQVSTRSSSNESQFGMRYSNAG